VPRTKRIAELLLAAGLAGFSFPANAVAQTPDARGTKGQLSELLNHYPPALKQILALDPGLLTNQPYLAPYPALVAFLNTHPEVARNPSFYIDDETFRRDPPDASRQIFGTLSVFLGFSMAIGVIIWLIKTIIDYRRWNRLTKVQTDVHTRILDRFTDNADLLAYIQSHAGKRFLESAPIALDAAPRQVAAPMGRILWSAQAGLVITAAGFGLYLIGVFSNPRLPGNAYYPQRLEVLGAFGIAVGIGFVVSAYASFQISKRLGLIEPPQPARSELLRGE
jgi:hypothetical protein